MPIRSIVSVVGVSNQESKASRMNSLRVPGVVGSQFSGRSSPPMYSSKLAVGIGLDLVAEDVRLGNVAERFVQTRRSRCRGSCPDCGPCTVTLNQRAVPCLPVIL